MTVPWFTAPWPAYPGALIGLIALLHGLFTLFKLSQVGKNLFGLERSGQSPYPPNWVFSVVTRDFFFGFLITAFFCQGHYEMMGILICGLNASFVLNSVGIALMDNKPWHLHLHLGPMVVCGFGGLVGVANMFKWTSGPFES